MYEAFYGMKERPFSLIPDPSFLFMSSKHRFAFSMLEYALTGQAGFTVITGAIGSGKTTLIRHLLKRTNRSVNFGVISNTHESFGNLLQWILTAFNITVNSDDQATRYQAFVRYLIGQFGEGKQTILIVDEAQNLPIESLEELRLLSNINADKDQLLQMILVGQPELLDKLKRPELVQFAQRISVSYHLSALSYRETKGYIEHRLEVAGGDAELFSELAVKAVFHFTTGIPRMINSICDMALVYGYAETVSIIDVDTILAVVHDKQKSALLPVSNVDLTLGRDETIAAVNASATASMASDPVIVRKNVPAEHAARLKTSETQPIFNNDNGDGSPIVVSGDPKSTFLREQERILQSNTIVPVMSSRVRRTRRPARVNWFLRLL